MPSSQEYDQNLLQSAPALTKAQIQGGYDTRILREPSPAPPTQPPRQNSVPSRQASTTPHDIESGISREKIAATSPASRPSFWRSTKGKVTIAVLVIIIIAAAVGGGVGGSKAGKKKTSSGDSSGIGAAPVGGSSTSSSPSPSPTGDGGLGTGNTNPTPTSLAAGGNPASTSVPAEAATTQPTSPGDQTHDHHVGGTTNGGTAGNGVFAADDGLEVS